MAAFWARGKELQAKELQAPVERPAARPTAAAPPAGAPRREVERTLEAIGMRNEALRAQFQQVGDGLAGVERTREQFQALLPPLSDLLVEFEICKARLQELKTKHALIEDAHASLNARHATTQTERETAAAAAAAAQRDNRELRQRLQRVETALAAAQSEMREGAAAREKFERALETESRRAATQADEIGRLRGELAARDQSVAKTELALKEASDQGALAAQDNVSLRETGTAQAERLEAALRRIAEDEAAGERDKQRIAALEQALVDEQGAHANLRAKHLDHVERTRSEISALANSVHAVRGRVEVTNKLLDQTRAQFRDKVEELRAAERRALECDIQIDALEKSERALKEDLAAANDHMAGVDRMRASLVDEVNTLNEAVRAKDIALQAATRNGEVLAARLADGAAATRRAKEEAERRIASMQEEIVRLRSERQLADGALEASRVERREARLAGELPSAPTLVASTPRAVAV
jgi:chromosome segregation ATPase